MIQSHLQLAEFSGCVVTTCQTQSPLPGQNNRKPPSDPYRGGNEKQVDQSSARSDSEGLWSCSGVILDHSAGIVICQAAVFFPFLKEKDRRSSDHTMLSAGDFPSDLSIQVECPFKARIDAEQKAQHQVLDRRSGLGLVPVSIPQAQRMQCNAELLIMLPCPEFQTAFSSLFMKGDGWVFSSEEEKEYGEFQKDLEYLHWFAVLKLQSPLPKDKLKLDIMESTSLVKGSTVFACGSPFGSFYPDIFLNTVSKGVLSNTAGDGNVLLLTDARCLPGSEGGGVYLFENGNLHLIGIIVAPLCWKVNEWVGLTLACSIGHIIHHIIKALGKANLSALEMGSCVVDRPRRGVGPSEHIMAAAVLVDSGQSWGSGVLVKSKLVLTCRHVVRHSSKVSVKIHNAKMASSAGFAFKR